MTILYLHNKQHFDRSISKCCNFFPNEPLKAPSANKQQISLGMTQNPSQHFTFLVNLNRVCVTVAKRLEILKVNISESRMFFTDLKNIENS